MEGRSRECEMGAIEKGMIEWLVILLLDANLFPKIFPSQNVLARQGSRSRLSIRHVSHIGLRGRLKNTKEVEWEGRRSQY